MLKIDSDGLKQIDRRSHSINFTHKSWVKSHGDGKLLEKNYHHQKYFKLFNYYYLVLSLHLMCFCDPERCIMAPKRSTGYNYNKVQAHYKLHSRLFDDDEYCNRSKVLDCSVYTCKRIVATSNSTVFIYDECHLLLLPLIHSMIIIIAWNNFFYTNIVSFRLSRCLQITFLIFSRTNFSWYWNFIEDSLKTFVEQLIAQWWSVQRQITGSVRNLIRFCNYIYRA